MILDKKSRGRWVRGWHQLHLFGLVRLVFVHVTGGDDVMACFYFSLLSDINDSTNLWDLCPPPLHRSWDYPLVLFGTTFFRASFCSWRVVKLCGRKVGVFSSNTLLLVVCYSWTEIIADFLYSLCYKISVANFVQVQLY